MTMATVTTMLAMAGHIGPAPKTVKSDEGFAVQMA
jgi:hypothetical protein